MLKAKWFLFLKWLIAILSVCYIVYHISSRGSLIDSSSILSVWEQSSVAYEVTITFIFLMFLNWLVEALKWKLLVGEVESISLLKSIRAVLTGLTLSFYAPNRSGEFLGRVVHLKPQHRVMASLLTFIGSISQLTVTLQAGLAAMVLYLFPQAIWLSFNGFNFQYVIVFLLMVLSFFLLLNTTKWMEQLKRIKFMAKYASRFDILQKITFKKLMIVYALSVVRYFVFAFQFYLLLSLCNVRLPAPEMIAKLALSFMFTSIIPSIALGELGVRSTVNLHLFSLNHSNDTAVLVASFMLWLVNIAIPALVGALCSFYIKWYKPANK